MVPDVKDMREHLFVFTFQNVDLAR